MKGFWVKPMTLADEQELDIRIDVKEDDKAYLVKADIPGVTKDDIRVDVDGNLVSIRAEVKRASEAKDGERVLRSECYAGTVSRSFTLPYDLDLEGADAKYADGVLELRLPKESGAAARQLTVK
jgi:HSP20 family protein